MPEGNQSFVTFDLATWSLNLARNRTTTLMQIRSIAILAALRNAADDDAKTVKYLAEHLRVGKPVISRTLLALAIQGLITCTTRTTDKRVIEANLTDAGRASLIFKL